MTEKRFRISQGYSDKFCHDWEKNKLLNFKQIVDLLNNLEEENEQLKSKHYWYKQYKELLNENEQLKQFQDSVFSWIDMHLQRLPTLRDDEFESDNEFADPSLYSGAIQILETMKIELKGDVE